MENDLTERIKRARQMLIKRFLLSFLLPHICIILVLLSLNQKIEKTLIYHLLWFSAYTGFIAICYLLTPLIIKK